MLVVFTHLLIKCEHHQSKPLKICRKIKWKLITSYVCRRLRIQLSGSGWGSSEASFSHWKNPLRPLSIVRADMKRKTSSLVVFPNSHLSPVLSFGLQCTLGSPPTPLLLVNGNFHSFWTLGGGNSSQTVTTLIHTSSPHNHWSPVCMLASAHTHTHTQVRATVTNTCTAVIAHAAGHTSRPPCGHQRSNYTSQYETHW